LEAASRASLSVIASSARARRSEVTSVSPRSTFLGYFLPRERAHRASRHRQRRAFARWRRADGGATWADHGVRKLEWAPRRWKTDALLLGDPRGRDDGIRQELAMGIGTSSAARCAQPEPSSRAGSPTAARVPHTWYPRNCGHITIRLTRDVAKDPPRAIYQLAHEVVHLISPSGRVQVGLRTWRKALRQCSPMKWLSGMRISGAQLRTLTEPHTKT
jgi:hypothetical protein